jgi:hypothetical protein
VDEILELSALAPEHVKVTLRWEQPGEDGAPVQHEQICELAERRDFGLLEFAHMSRMGEELDKIESSPKPSKAQEARYAKLIDELAAKLILGAPDAAIRQLPQVTKADVIQRFFVLATSERMEAVTRFLPASLLPDSSDSTGATPEAG